MARAMSVDVTKGVPTAEFQRPKGAIWSDKQGQEHETAAVKARLDVFTGDASSRIPPDPYAPPHVTPAQVRHRHRSQDLCMHISLSLIVPPRRFQTQKFGIRKGQAHVEEMNDNHEHAMAQGRKLSNSQKDSASEMKNILRSWNTDAYETIDSGWHKPPSTLKIPIPECVSSTSRHAPPFVTTACYRAITLSSLP